MINCGDEPTHSRRVLLFPNPVLTSQRRAFYTTTLKATPNSVYLVNSTFIDAAFSELTDIPGILTSVTYQTITRDWLFAAKASGGDSMNLDPENGAIIGKVLLHSNPVYILMPFSHFDLDELARCNI
jgi:hypothetical protein